MAFPHTIMVLTPVERRIHDDCPDCGGPLIQTVMSGLGAWEWISYMGSCPCGYVTEMANLVPGEER